MNDMIIGQKAATGVPPADLIKDTDTKRFMVDVIEASKRVPVLVDFWAPWCGPCRQLTPLLEKVVKQANGKVRLVKINVDENQQIAAQMRVQSIPAVFAFFDGQPIDGFMGALPEGQIKQFIEKLGNKGSLAEEIAAALKVADEAMQRKAFDEAQNILGTRRRSGHVAALSGFAKCRIELGDLDGAAATLASVPNKTNANVVSALAALDLALHPVDISLLERLQKAVATAPDDFQKRLELAVALNGVGQKSEATDQLLYVIRKKRDWNDDAARNNSSSAEAWGPKDEATLQGRRPYYFFVSTMKFLKDYNRPGDLPDRLPVFPLPGACSCGATCR
jgi:putative thioredoxin